MVKHILMWISSSMSTYYVCSCVPFIDLDATLFYDKKKKLSAKASYVPWLLMNIYNKIENALNIVSFAKSQVLMYYKKFEIQHKFKLSVGMDSINLEIILLNKSP